jgi:hypothetical protein
MMQQSKAYFEATVGAALSRDISALRLGPDTISIQ